MAEPKLIHRGRTAISRTSLSKPLRLALEASVVRAGDSLFDYGCGLGDDVRALESIGITADGWDPTHRPDTKLHTSSVVNLGYVANVIECVQERDAALREAWNLCERVLVVAARLTFDARLTQAEAYEDGCITNLRTFQKLYSQSELREWIDATLEVQSVAVAPGIFFVFRDTQAEQDYLAARYQHRRVAPKVRKSDLLFEEHRSILGSLIDFVTARGRLPIENELSQEGEIRQAFGSIRKAFAVVRRVTGTEQWQSFAEDRRNELRIQFALERFGGRPALGQLPSLIRHDIRGLFSTYKRLCSESDTLLFAAGNIDEVRAAGRKSPIGKITASALYIHVDAVHRLPQLLRVYEGCASTYIGSVEEANIVKLDLLKPKVSYLAYPKFDTDPHPSLASAIVVPLRAPKVWYRDYSASDNPPILHRKETFVADDDPRRIKFERLTKQECRYGLLDDTQHIGTRRGWDEILQRSGFRLKGHRLVKS